MSYCFRIRCRIGNTAFLSSDDTNWILSDDHDEECVILSSSSGPLREARELIVVGASYESETDASAAGKRWLQFLAIAFSRMHIGVDFGDRAPDGAWTPFGLKALSEANDGVVVLNDVHGLMVFEHQSEIRFATSRPATLMVGATGPAMLRAIRAAAKRRLAMSPQQLLAFDLYAASFNESNADARFVMLMMALETLIPQTDRSAAAVAHVTELIELTNSSALTQPEKASLVSSLEWLRFESIGKSGRALAASLGTRTYMGGSPERRAEKPTNFFTNCYQMRSRLVHGYFPRPSREDVGVRAAALEGFVADLLAGELLAFDPQPLRVNDPS